MPPPVRDESSPPAPPPQPQASLIEASVIVALCFGLFIASSLSVAWNGFHTEAAFSDAAFLQIIGRELVLGGLALVLLKRRGYALQRLLPRPSLGGSLIGAGLLFVTLFVWMLLGQALQISDYAAQPIAQIVERSHPSPAMVLIASIINGVYEETFLVGYLVRGLRRHGAAIAVGLSVLVRLLYHVYQGPIGALSVVVFGVMVGFFYWRTRLLWPVAFAHILEDLIAFSYTH